MFACDPIVKQERKCIVVGRAATGIYLVLSNECEPGKEVVVPANICYAAIFPIIYAGMMPRFCDVDPESGNVSFETFQAACSAQTCAAIVPHMYGNPVASMRQIASYCKLNHILLIEDCASAMGAEADYPLGRMGDYTIYSMGYSKTLDLGCGGLVCSEKDLTGLLEAEQELPMLTVEAEKSIGFFSKVYRTTRNYGQGSELEKCIYRELPGCLRGAFLYRISEHKKRQLYSRIADLPQVIQVRRRMLQLYERNLEDCRFHSYHFSQGAVPWRFNLLCGPGRQVVIAEMLKRGYPVSDWYPSVVRMFEDVGEYAGAEWHENHIINFPLLIEEAEVEAICALLTRLSYEYPDDSYAQRQ